MFFLYRKDVILTHSPVVDIREGLEAIIKALIGNHSLPLERLELEWKCTFTDTAADHLVQFVSNTTTQQYLRIWSCTVSAHRLLELAKAVHDNSTLQKKSLQDFTCTVNGDDEAKELAQLLVEYPQVMGGYENSTLIAQISNVGVVALAEALHHNTTLTWLDLSNTCCSGDAGAEALAQALHHNSTLKVLDLSNNTISDAGAVALAQVLHHNSTLEKLMLYNNSICDAGAEALAQALRNNFTMCVLNLGCNDSIGETGAVQLVQALHANTFSKTYGCLYIILPKKCEGYATHKYHRYRSAIYRDLVCFC